MRSFATLLAIIVFIHAQNPATRLYKSGEKFNIQCKNYSGEWDNGPLCQETDKAIIFLYGIDQLTSCSIKIQSNQEYEYIKFIVQQKATWSCRVRMVYELEVYIPFSLPIWGIVDGDNIRIDNRMNFIFHAAKGKIVGAAAYPVMNELMTVDPKNQARLSQITIQGPVKWFEGHSYSDFSSVMTFGTATVDMISTRAILFCCGVTFALSGMIFTLLYHFHYKPELMKSAQKKE